MLIRDKYKLMEICETIYEEKEGRFVFRDMRNRTLARISIPNPKDFQLVEYALQSMIKLNMQYGYVDIYELNQLVDDYAPDREEEKPKEEPKIEVKEIKIEPKEEVKEVKEVKEVVEKVEPKEEEEVKEVVEKVEPKEEEEVKEIAEKVEPKEEPKVEVKVEVKDKETTLEVPKPVEVKVEIQKPEQQKSVTITRNKAEYLSDFVLQAMQCTTLEFFKNLIKEGYNLGITKKELTREMKYVSRDKLITYCRALQIKPDINYTRETLGSLILDNLNL